MGDNTLSRLRRKLEQAELEHLRQHCTDLASRLEIMEERATHAEGQADWYWRQHSDLIQSLTEQGETIGVTREGDIGVVAKPETISVPELAAGETYVATLIDAAEGKGYHLIILPGDNDSAPWAEQMAWAKSTGGELPTRVEQSLIYAKHKDLFHDEVYWSCTENGAGYAWVQSFNDGNQDYDHNDFDYRAVAVRRLPI